MEARQLRQQALSETRRGLVLDAARAVFEEHGLEGASIREIARRAGYTPGAIYSYFESKEAIYGALLGESLDRLNQAVQDAVPDAAGAAALLRAKALGWFGFYAANPRELDLGFYLVHGLAPRGLTSELNQRLNARLHEALAPCEQALVAAGFGPAAAARENTALFAHGVGLLLLQHTGRIRMFRQDASELFTHYLAALLQRTASIHEKTDAARR
jgi:AcrR family transcriptional regulator